VGGLTTLTAAAVVVELARRRRRQQRRRKAGQRIAMPLPDSGADLLEREVRAGADWTALPMLHSALRHLIDAALTAGSAPPRLWAARLSPDTIELILDPESDPSANVMAPFHLTVDCTWSATWDDLDSSQQVEHDDDDRANIIYPALVTVGVSDGSIVVANLEAAGTFTVISSGNVADRAADVVRALACELVTSPLTDQCTLLVDTSLDTLSTITEPSRLQVHTKAGVQRAFHARETRLREVLVGAGIDGLLQARLTEPTIDLGNPQIFTSLAKAGVRATAWTGLCVISTGDHVDSSGWTLEVSSGGARLHPVGIDLQPQHLTSASFNDLITLLSISNETSEIPVPAPSSSTTQTAPSLTLASAEFTAGPYLAEHVRLPAHLGSTSHHPRVKVLGPLRISTSGSREQDLRGRRIAELITYVALHPNSTAPAIDDALWRGTRVTRSTRNSLTYRARTWLGVADDGHPYFSHTNAAGQVRLHPDVTCDWDDFRYYLQRNASTPEERANDLASALNLVRGAPFSGVDPAAYGWAEFDSQTMTSCIVDAAHELAVLHLATGDTRAAIRAARQGLRVEPLSELLFRDALTAAAATGDTLEFGQVEQQLRDALERLDPEADLDPETIELLSHTARE
jgi:DNA-binding SARP family transcriptional activator